MNLTVKLFNVGVFQTSKDPGVSEITLHTKASALNVEIEPEKVSPAAADASVPLGVSAATPPPEPSAPAPSPAREASAETATLWNALQSLKQMASWDPRAWRSEKWFAAIAKAEEAFRQTDDGRSHESRVLRSEFEFQRGRLADLGALLTKERAEWQAERAQLLAARDVWTARCAVLAGKVLMAIRLPSGFTGIREVSSSVSEALEAAVKEALPRG